MARIGWLGLGVVAACVLSGDGTARTSLAAGGDAMEVHVDPATGRLVPEPVDGRRPAGVPAPAVEPLEASAPGGGVMSVVPPQYHSRMVATVEADGSVRMDCVVPAQERR